MRIRASWVLCCFLVGGTAFAQSPASPKGSSVQERLIYSSDERLQWEAAQMLNSPAVPIVSEAIHHSIHLDQPPLTPPRIRREWLQPSPEAASPVTNPDVADVIESPSYLPKKTP